MIHENEALLTDDLMENLNEEEKKKIQEIANSINIQDTNGIIQFGSAAQSGIASFSDTLLEEVKTKDTGQVGEILSKLIVEIKGMNPDTLLEKSFFGKFFGGLKRRIQKFMTNYERISVNVDRIVYELDKAKMSLLRDVKMLDLLYDKNTEYLSSLDSYIIAGNMKLKEINEITLPNMQKSAVESGDAMDAQEYKDMEQMANRFEKKLHDLKLSRMIAIQTAPQIRIIQNNNQAVVEKIQSSIMNTIPLWKNQIIIAIALFRQEGALKLQEEVTKTTNDLLSKNSELLKDNSIRVAKESQKGIVQVETLKKVQNDLISTIEETLKIEEEGKIKRQKAERELQNMETQLKEKLVEIKS